ncbi:nuclear receptor-interacting protein 3 isoform X3 [Papio anubis]|nr:nuclear receptor-interacting protein 3 isoform X3 [Papio anubis]
METNLSKLRSGRVPWASKTNKVNQAKSEGLKKSEEDDMILVSCQCAGKDVKALVDTGCLYNLISLACVDRLGLKELVKSHKHEGEKLSLPRHLKVVGQIEHLVITLGSLCLDCPAAVVDDNEKNLSLGLQTLRSLKCIINLDKHRLIMGKTDKEEIPFVETVSLNEDNLTFSEYGIISSDIYFSFQHFRSITTACSMSAHVHTHRVDRLRKLGLNQMP